MHRLWITLRAKKRKLAAMLDNDKFREEISKTVSNAYAGKPLKGYTLAVSEETKRWHMAISYLGKDDQVITDHYGWSF